MSKTNELQKISSVKGTDCLLVDTDKEGTGIMTFDDASRVITKNIPNPNLLRNWYFGNKASVINQRGQDTYTGAVYGIDGWKGWNPSSVVTIDEDGLSTSGFFIQPLESPFFSPGVYTISALTESGVEHLQVYEKTMGGLAEISSDSPFVSKTIYTNVYRD